MTQLPRLLKVREIAETLGQTPKWVYRAHDRHGLPAIRVGRSLLFDEGAVQQWLERQRDNGATD